MNEDTYTLKICGLTRELPVIPVSNTLAIASFVIPGDTRLIEAAAEALAEKLSDEMKSCEIDYLVCPEAKAVPLTPCHGPDHGPGLYRCQKIPLRLI